MTTKDCNREQEVLAAMLAGRATGDLAAHAESCRVCCEVAGIAALVHQDVQHAQQHARVPAADIVWLRAQMRAREEAERTAARPILIMQALAIAAFFGLLVSLAGRLSLQAWTWPRLAALGPDIPLLLPLGIALASWLVLAPVALYLAFSRD
jgi:hypothetical protein